MLLLLLLLLRQRLLVLPAFLLKASILVALCLHAQP
jgi:hypothetical protein